MNNLFYDRKKVKIISIIGIIMLLIIGISIATNKQKSNIAKKQDGKELMMSSSNAIDSEKAVNNIGFEDIKEEPKTETKNEVKKSNETVKENKSKVGKTTSTVAKNENVSNKNQNEENKKLNFAFPVNGDIIQEFAKDKLVYSNTLGEWITHLGIDIKAKKTELVKAAEDGKVKAIKQDPRYGLTVIVEHTDGFTTIYSNLLTAEFIKENEEVKKGQTIGTVGNISAFEIADEPHLHFEMLKDGEHVDPTIYLKK